MDSKGYVPEGCKPSDGFLRHEAWKPTAAEWRIYDRIVKLMPELASYKRSTVYQVSVSGTDRGFPTLKKYYAALKNDPEERAYLRTHLTCKGSHFFRGKGWQFFDEECLSTFAGSDNVKVWCAGCSSGEEAYSTVMCLLEHVPIDAVDVLATDYNTDLLAKCDEGFYFNMHLEAVPEKYRTYLDLDKTRFFVKKELRDVVHTEHLNLITDEYPKGFDVIVCRNVIKFFANEIIVRVKRQLVESLNPGGFLFLSIDDGDGKELIDNPEELGVEQLGDLAIYRKL